jgi:hypothetical protein
VRKYEATYTEMAGQGGVKAAGIFRASMNIKVMGWHDRTDAAAVLLEREKKQKMVLIRGAMTILNSRITGIAKAWNAIPGQNAKTTTLVDAKIIEKVGYPELELQVTVNYGDANRTEFMSRLNNMGNPIPIDAYDPRWWPIDNEWGRLPVGNGDAGNLGDKDNPNFANTAYPYAESGDPAKSDYFTGYFQPPGNNRHSLPRITGRTVLSEDTSKEWARPGGFFSGSGGVGSEFTPWSDAQAANPISDSVLFSAIPSKTLAGSVALGPAAFVSSDSYTGIAAVQESGFQYIAYSSEVMNDTSQGQIYLPLSVPRNIPQAKRELLLGLSAGTGPSTSGKECSVALSLCAPETVRVYSVSSTRSQRWGEIPEPLPQIVRSVGSDTTAQIVQVETLVKKEFLGETPELRADGITREFTHHARYTYALSNPWRATLAEGRDASGDTETLPVSFSPICKATSANNAIKLVGGDSPLLTSAKYDA